MQSLVATTGIALDPVFTRKPTELSCVDIYYALMRSARQVSQQQESAPSDSDNDDITNSTPTADEVMDALAKALNAHDDLSDSIKDFSRRTKAKSSIRYHVRKRSEEHTSELQSLMRNSYSVFCFKKKK